MRKKVRMSELSQIPNYWGFTVFALDQLRQYKIQSRLNSPLVPGETVRISRLQQIHLSVASFNNSHLTLLPICFTWSSLTSREVSLAVSYNIEFTDKGKNVNISWLNLLNTRLWRRTRKRRYSSTINLGIRWRWILTHNPRYVVWVGPPGGLNIMDTRTHTHTHTLNMRYKILTPAKDTWRHSKPID
jgi:hypothetical protein